MIAKQITAVEWLVEQVNSDCTNSSFIRPELFLEAKLMEATQLDNAFKLGLEFGTEKNDKTNNLDKIEVYDILKNLFSIDNELISKYPQLLTFVESAYEQLNKADGITIEILRNFKKEDVLNPQMEQVINQLKELYHGK